MFRLKIGKCSEQTTINGPEFMHPENALARINSLQQALVNIYVNIFSARVTHRGDSLTFPPRFVRHLLFAVLTPESVLVFHV